MLTKDIEAKIEARYPGLVTSTFDTLPNGYEVFLNEHNDWTLLPPEDVTIFSEPGEGVLLFNATDEAGAMREAIAYLASV